MRTNQALYISVSIREMLLGYTPHVPSARLLPRLVFGALSLSTIFFFSLFSAFFATFCSTFFFGFAFSDCFTAFPFIGIVFPLHRKNRRLLYLVTNFLTFYQKLD